MRELVFALEFRGKAAPVAGTDGAREAETMASGMTLATFLGGDWLRARLRPIGGGEIASLQAAVQRFDDGTFVEAGAVDYGGAGGLGVPTARRGGGGAGAAPRAHGGGGVWRGGRRGAG